MKRTIILAIILLSILNTPQIYASTKITDNVFDSPVWLHDKTDSVKIDNGLSIELLKDETGVDKLYKPTGEVLVHSQRITVEYQDGKQWRTLGAPYKVTTQKYSETVHDVTRHYTDNHGTEVRVVYHFVTEQPLKMDVVIESGADRNYRVRWSLDGITLYQESYEATYIQFGTKDEYIRCDFSDVLDQGVEIDSLLVTDASQGKHMEMVFLVGFVGVGETYTLDPAIVVSYPNGNTNYVNMKNRHPSTNATVSAIAQTFNVTGDDFNINNVTLRMGKNGNPTANIYLYLYDITETYGVNATPSGAYLAVSEAFNTSTAAGADVNFTFTGANQYKCLSGHQYALALQAPSVAAGGVYNKANYAGMWIDNTAPTYSGNWANYSSSAWTGSAAIDLYFIIYETVYWDPVSDVIDEAFNFWGIADALSDLATYVNNFVTYWSTVILYIPDLVVQQMRILVNIFTWFMRWITRFFDMILALGAIITGLLNGTGDVTTAIGNWWTYFELANWYELLVLVSILYWLDSVARRGMTQGEVKVFIDDLQTLTNIMSYFLSVFSFILNTIVDYTFRLFEAIIP